LNIKLKYLHIHWEKQGFQKHPFMLMYGIHLFSITLNKLNAPMIAKLTFNNITQNSATTEQLKTTLVFTYLHH